MASRLSGGLRVLAGKASSLAAGGVKCRHMTALCKGREKGPALQRHAVIPTQCRRYHESEIEEEFKSKVEQLRELDRTKFTFQTNLDLDVYYNQAVRGPCEGYTHLFVDADNARRGMLLEKWNELGDMAPDIAMATFIELVTEVQGFGSAVMQKERKDIERFEEEQMAFAVYGTEDLVITVEDHVQTIRFNRPTRLNAFTVQMFSDMAAALREAEEDDDIYLTVFTGTGEYFTSGNDLSNFDLSNTTLPKLIKTARDTLQAFVATFIDHPKPLVAAVNGPAVGIGVTMLGLCDIVLASTAATFQTPFTSLGQSPEACSSYIFPRMMGPARANDVLLLGHKLNAEDAHQNKLVSRLVFADTFERDYPRVIRWMTSLPQESLRMSRSLIRSYDREKLHEVNRLECDLLTRRWASPECYQALEAFNKRHKRDLERRLELLEGRDSRVVMDRVQRMKKELAAQEEILASLPDSSAVMHDQLEPGDDESRGSLPDSNTSGSGFASDASIDSSSDSTQGEATTPKANDPKWKS